MDNKSGIKVGTVLSFNSERGFGFLLGGRLEGHLIRHFREDRSRVFFHGNAYRLPVVVGGSVGIVFAPEGYTQRCPKEGDTILFFPGENGSRGSRARVWCYEDDAKKTASETSRRYPLRMMVDSAFSDEGPVEIWRGSDLTEIVKHFPYLPEDDYPHDECAFELDLECMRSWRRLQSRNLDYTVSQEVLSGLITSGTSAWFERETSGSWAKCSDPRRMPIW